MLLRSEARGRAIGAVSARNIARVEPDPAVAEEEARSPAKPTIAIIGKLFAAAIHVQFFPTDEPFGMNQNDRSDCDAGEAVLVGHEDFAATADRTSSVSLAELRGDDEDVALLLFGDFLHRFQCAGGNPQVSRVDLTIAPVVERTRFGDLLMDDLKCPAVLLGGVSDLGEVLLGQRVHRLDGEPSLGAFG
ncbi:MAG: hypothetical protein CEN87_353 [Parcubacteria group bacterium Licking1014_1]|nr:MAG: hypothetical protein CEN87_353 [Parcubacteria group bacterium Licking1014_1]